MTSDQQDDRHPRPPLNEQDSGCEPAIGILTKKDYTILSLLRHVNSANDNAVYVPAGKRRMKLQELGLVEPFIPDGPQRPGFRAWRLTQDGHCFVETVVDQKDPPAKPGNLGKAAISKGHENMSGNIHSPSQH